MRRHCWVRGLAEAPGRWPGLLVEWRRAPGTARAGGTGAGRPGPGGAGPGGAGGDWEGRVVYLVTDGVTPVVVEAWLPAAHLAPG